MMQTLKKPVLAENVFLAPGSIVRGDVTLMEDVNVWFHAVIRAEAGSVVIGSSTNIQDGCVIHVDQGADVAIGSQTTIGHNATIHGCTIGNNTLIGMGAIIMNHAVIGDNCIVAAGALVPQNTVVPDNSLVMGNPAKIKRTVTAEEISHNQQNAAHYIAEAAVYAQTEQYILLQKHGLAKIRWDLDKQITAKIDSVCEPNPRKTFSLYTLAVKYQKIKEVKYQRQQADGTSNLQHCRTAGYLSAPRDCLARGNNIIDRNRQSNITNQVSPAAANMPEIPGSLPVHPDRLSQNLPYTKGQQHLWDDLYNPITD